MFYEIFYEKQYLQLVVPIKSGHFQYGIILMLCIIILYYNSMYAFKHIIGHVMFYFLFSTCVLMFISKDDQFLREKKIFQSITSRVLIVFNE